MSEQSNTPRLPAVAAIHRFENEARRFIQATAENLLAHGYHKDLLYYSVFKAIKVCHEAGISEAREWLLRLAAPIAHIEHYTDSDEVGRLPRDMADLLAEIAPDLLPIYLQWLTVNEEYYDALHAFHAFLDAADLSLSVNQAVAITALDDDGLSILQKKAEVGDTGAQSALSRLVEVIGRIPESEIRTQEEHSSSPELEKKPLPPPNAYPPSQFPQYLEALREAYYFSDRVIIQEWAQYWIDQGQTKNVFAAMELDAKNGLRVSYYDQMFDLALRLYGKDRAYSWLVSAHKEDSGWSWFFSDKSHIVQRWEAIEKYYADRWYDFISDTYKSRYGVPWQDLYISHHSFGRLVEYYIRMNQLDSVKEIVGRIVDISLEYTSPLQLAVPEWATSPKPRANESQKESSLEILFQRLVWPSLLVRERACVAIADLLLNPQEATYTQTYLLNWMKSGELESYITLGLLVLHRTRFQNPSVLLPAFEEVVSAISKPSILSWMLLDELFPEANYPLENSLSHSSTPPPDFSPSPQFEKYVTSYIPPLYNWYAAQIEENELIAFRRQWAFEWSKLMEQSQAEVRISTLDFWLGARNGGKRYVAVDTLVSDIYMSAYIRALAWALQDRGLDANTGISLAAQTCQIDLELWRLTPSPKPSWWPQVVISNEALDSAPTQIWKQVENLWEEQKRRTDGWLITQASGLIEAGDTVYELELSGMIQKTWGSAEPVLEDISQWYREKSGVTTKQKSLLRLQGTLTDRDVIHSHYKSGGWDLLALAGRAVIQCGLRWQYWRLRSGIWLPTSILGDQPLSFKVDNNGLMVCDGDKVIGKWNDWCNGLSEKAHTSLPLQTGQFLVAQRDRIDKLAEKNKAAFCWVCQLTVYHRKESYLSDYQQFSSYQLFGGSQLIL